ncbi:MEKHLA domain-containing protein [Uliginosibacterium sp. 31-12]|uniref:MEKHLA domain-containing protein n=1 Tax=Uliginosibacterium sp. 31-12 TaxID=3062781 RepID=UPI0026E22549|nr:MEKHLA domain-containing protein [Uliginosibacterium sp. 31-12]MDO6387678.1 MEKHLA domain-containing protein [Uliginosibacterium sp. 31-12]
MTQSELVALICASHQRLLGLPLADPALSALAAARWLAEEAPFCVLAHEAGVDPRFIFANRAACECFEYPREELVGLPSRLSAEAPDRAERQALLDAVASKDFATGYRGLRIAKSGRRFWIEDVTVWNLVDEAGVTQGQAATYRRITPHEGN